ncbi:MAG TPA: biopolymer transporter TolR [Chryseosolibacter sp.]|nr:biopolymer transporter TolR [Chryseosolibacter sp.]
MFCRVVLIIAITLPSPTVAQIVRNPLFEGFTHVGNPAQHGVLEYDSVQQLYSIEGASGNMWGARDDFHFLWTRISGNFILQATAEFIGKGVDPHRKVGVMVRHSLEANSPHINVVAHGDGLTALQYRRTPGGTTEEQRSSISAPDVIQLERRDSVYIMSVAKFGDPFTTIETTRISLGDEVYLGLFLCSHNEDAVEQVKLRNVRLVVPARKGLVPYREFLGSHIEVMEVETGARTIVYSENTSLQAPNWTTDGRSLIYNANGKLYEFSLDSRIPKTIPTDFAVKNNNDHVLSFDGKMLGISHHSQDDRGNSVIYVMPAGGGKPVRVTPLSPSYLHGWSPDGKYLVYTGGRNDEYDIYRIGVKGGKETRLTQSKGLDDGSEYSPDGKYIYFNSTRSGTMQIWRMNADGSNQIQVTNDEYNNWFPHISPDGKRIVFLSYMKDVAPDDHPFYKPVYLRIMDVNGSSARVIAYLYGGQGTINVPSWSPDSKRIAFVSNSTFR